MVTSSAGRSSLLATTPLWMPYLPVRRAARLGQQTTAALYQRRKTAPSFASRSRFGVFQSVRPLKPTSPQPRASAGGRTRFGGRSAAGRAGTASRGLGDGEQGR